MTFLIRLLDRALPALLMAASVVLLSAGLFSYAAPTGGAAQPTSFDPGEPIFSPAPTDTPSAEPSPSPSASPTPSDSLDPQPSGPVLPSPSSSPSPGTTALPSDPVGQAFATRIVIPSLNVDLPVVAGDLDVPGNRNSFPLCDVAQYLTMFNQPGEAGTTYIYAHARTGMFLPLLEASRRNNGRSTLGALVEVYASSNRLHLYEITLVKRHATDLSLAHNLPAGQEQLVLQTSEGPRGTIPKLQVAARPIGVVAADPGEANPPPRPRVCR